MGELPVFSSLPLQYSFPSPSPPNFARSKPRIPSPAPVLRPSLPTNSLLVPFFTTSPGNPLASEPIQSCPTPRLVVILILLHRFIAPAHNAYGSGAQLVSPEMFLSLPDSFQYTLYPTARARCYPHPHQVAVLRWLSHCLCAHPWSLVLMLRVLYRVILVSVNRRSMHTCHMSPPSHHIHSTRPAIGAITAALTPLYALITGSYRCSALWILFLTVQMEALQFSVF